MLNTQSEKGCWLCKMPYFIGVWFHQTVRTGSRAITHTEARTAASAQDKRHFTCIDGDNICFVLHDVHANFDNDDGYKEAARLRGVGYATWSDSNLPIYCLERKCWFKRCFHCLVYRPNVVPEIRTWKWYHFFQWFPGFNELFYSWLGMYAIRSVLMSIWYSSFDHIFFSWFDITLFLITRVVQMTIRSKSA